MQIPFAPPQQVHIAHILKLPSFLLLSFIIIIIFPASITGTIGNDPFASYS
jgi:hypothetical protein